MVQLLSIKDISEKLGIPQSTLRYYRDIFMEYLPSCGEGKKKRFFKESVDVFAAIAKGMQQNKSADEISADLDVKFARFIEAKIEAKKVNKVNGESEINTGPNAQENNQEDEFYGGVQSQNSGATNPQTPGNGQLQVLNTQFGNQPILNAEAIMAAIKNQNQTMKEIASTLNVVAEHQEEIASLKRELVKLEEQVEDQLTKHFQVIDSKIAKVTVEHRAEKNKPTSFWQRLFG